ncbi:MAG TPA: signal peptidase II [Gemmatimonadaceae bacterium]|nr:signal peptidase II [Gemmatimonadaceae bacterium]
MATALESSATSGGSARARAFWPLFTATFAADVVTKRLAEGRLPPHVPHDVAGEWVRLTLTYNTGAAMNLSLGDASRVTFTVLATAMLVVVFRLYRRTAQHAVAQAAALALIAAGALGNLLDRLRSARGVVDFIDLGIGAWRFWTFNVADVGVTIGAMLLAIVLWRRPRPVGAAEG